MGGAGFGETGKGRDASTVFNKLKENAMYEHGHGGYTGTIAEKPGYEMIPQPSQSDLRAVMQGQIKHAQNSIEWANKDLAQNPDPNNYWHKNATERIANAQKKIRELEARLADPTPIPVTREMLVAYADWYEEKNYNDKWGDAYCLVLKQPEPIKPIGKAKALTLAKKKYGETAEVTVKTERASKANFNQKRVFASITAVATPEPGFWGSKEPVKRVVKSAVASDEKTALGMLFSEEGEFYFFGVASS